jgi:hypothetical protein
MVNLYAAFFAVFALCARGFLLERDLVGERERLAVGDRRVAADALGRVPSRRLRPGRSHIRARSVRAGASV